jgi:hypothetical protein
MPMILIERHERRQLRGFEGGTRGKDGESLVSQEKLWGFKRLSMTRRGGMEPGSCKLEGEGGEEGGRREGGGREGGRGTSRGIRITRGPLDEGSNTKGEKMGKGWMEEFCSIDSIPKLIYNFPPPPSLPPVSLPPPPPLIFTPCLHLSNFLKKVW